MVPPLQTSKRGLDINSDYHVVAARVSFMVASKRQPSTNSHGKFNIEELKNPLVARNFEACISEKLETILKYLHIPLESLCR